MAGDKSDPHPERLYFSFDTLEMPGKCVCNYVIFGTEILNHSDAMFDKRVFHLVDKAEPRVASFLKLMTGNVKKA